MGGGSSISGKYPVASVESQPTGSPSGAEGLLTREMLDNLARKNFSPGKRGRGVAVGFSKSQFDTEDADKGELPPAVVKLFQRIGITAPNNGTDIPEQKSKLVSHIFECLGALQSLVNVSDLSYNPEMETQSMCERDTKAMGTLLHEMVSVYSLCGDTIQTLLASNPAAAAIEDSIGRLPLHVAVDCDYPWLQTVNMLVGAYPRACRERDGAGRLPLHIVVDRSDPCVDTIQTLLASYPDAAGTRRGVGRLAIHYACFCDSPSSTIIETLLQAYPEGASTTDLYGRLPLHYLLDHSITPSLESIRRILQFYPEAARIADTSGKYPLWVALERGHPVYIIRVLYDAYPRVVVDAKDPNRSLLHAYMELIDLPRVDIIRYILLTESGAHEAEEVLRIAREKGFLDAERELLRWFKLDNKRLRDLRWESRKMPLLLATCSDMHEVVESRQHFTMGGKVASNRRNMIKAIYLSSIDAFKEVVMFL